MPDWYWWLAFGLMFAGTLAVAVAEGLERNDDTQRWAALAGVPGLAIGAWGVAMAIVGGLLELLRWLL